MPHTTIMEWNASLGMQLMSQPVTHSWLPSASAVFPILVLFIILTAPRKKARHAS